MKKGFEPESSRTTALRAEYPPLGRSEDRGGRIHDRHEEEWRNKPAAIPGEGSGVHVRCGRYRTRPDGALRLRWWLIFRGAQVLAVLRTRWGRRRAEQVVRGYG